MNLIEVSNYGYERYFNTWGWFTLAEGISGGVQWKINGIVTIITETYQKGSSSPT